MATIAQPDVPPTRRTTETEIRGAIDLGWRVAALHGLRPSTFGPPPAGDLLLNRRSLGAVDRLELEVRAIAGVAARVGAPLPPDALQALIDLVPAAASSRKGEDRFGVELAKTHLALQKRLWAEDEAHGRAYELGNFLSDTWNRVLRPRTTVDSQDELHEVFSSERVQRMKVLLDNLQSRLDPTAVHVVANHLDAWHERIAGRPASAPGGDAAAPAAADVAAAFEPVERQTIIWRQMLTGDKEPEAYIDHVRRAQVRDELSRQLWRRYRRLWWIVPVVAVLGAVVGYLLANHGDAAAGLIGTLTAVGAVLGITQASMIATVKRGLQDWGELMWNRSLAAVICRETLVVDELLAPAAGAGAAGPDQAPDRRASRAVS